MGKSIAVSAGERYGRLVIVSEIRNAHFRKVLCQCDCGMMTEKYLSNLRNKGKRGPTLSCGCLRREATISRNIRHGLTNSPEYSIWAGMRKRCFNIKCPSYPNYGGRGITIDAEWDTFESFYRDMGPLPSSLHTIDRIDVNGNYSKSNCRWATRKEQNRNTRFNTLLTIDGVTQCVGAWSEQFSHQYNISRARFRSWYHRHGLDEAMRRIQEIAHANL